MAYTDLSEHQWMMEDTLRTASYGEALRREITPSDVVLDFGCGLGILAMLAARAGARKVYAVDRLPIVRLAHAIARKNGLTSIEFLHAPKGDFELPEPATVLVSEWMGHFALHEGMLTPLCTARDRHLTSAGRMIPRRITLKAALISNTLSHEKRRYFQTHPYGFDFSPVADWLFSEVTGERFAPSDVLGISSLTTLEMSTQPGLPAFVEAEITPRRPGVVHGLAGWFEADLGHGVTFDCGPGSAAMHWSQLFFPFAVPLQADPSRPIRVRLTPVQVDEVHTRWQWSAKDGTAERSGDDMTLMAYLRRPLAAGLLR